MLKSILYPFVKNKESYPFLWQQNALNQAPHKTHSTYFIYLHNDYRKIHVGQNLRRSQDLLKIGSAMRSQPAAQGFIHLDLENWTQYSRCHLLSARKRQIITSLKLLIILYSIRFLLAHCTLLLWSHQMAALSQASTAPLNLVSSSDLMTVFYTSLFFKDGCLFCLNIWCTQVFFLIILF